MSRPLVLLVDDLEDNRVILGTWLVHVGCRIEHAVDGRDAVDRAFATLPDLVLMDIHMPVMDGLAATRALRACAETASLHIVAMSAHGNAAAALDAGCDAFLPKPIDLRVLEAILEGRPEFVDPLGIKPEAPSGLRLRGPRLRAAR